MSTANPASAYQAHSPYIVAYFRQQHPLLMRWTALLAGFAAPSEATQQLAHCECGFGQGLGLAITAASCTDAQVGVDFMPEQVEQLSDLLTGSGITNAQLYATDFAGFLASNTQQFQSITLHGVWSWVAPEIRQQLIEIIRRFLADDGVVYISHNTLPGRAPLIPMQRLIVQTAAQFSHHDDQGLMAALAVINSMMPLSHYVQQSPELIAWWQSLAQAHPTYLAHEYLGHAWSPMLFSDTAALLAQAGLSFMCSADALELLPDLHLSEAQQSWLDAIDDINLRESYSDTLRNVGFRRDLWHKSACRLSADAQQTQLLQTALVLLHPVGALALTLTGDLGVFELPEAPLLLMLNHLAEHDYRPKTVAELWKRLAEQGIHVDFTAFKSLLIGLSALGYIHPAQTEHDVKQNSASAQALNRQLCQRAWQDGSVGYLASPLAGCGLQVSRLQQLLLLARAQTQSTNASDWATWLFAHRHLAVQPFCPDASASEQADWLATEAHQFDQVRLPLLLAHGVIANYKHQS
jgi:SAM-dependent methyltransferase